MSFFDFDTDTDELVKKVKKAVKKTKSAPKKTTDKPKKAVKVKPKVYKVAGSFSLDENGAVIKKTKAIHDIKKGKKGSEKEYTVTFVVKTK
jgi:hypothetical protein